MEQFLTKFSIPFSIKIYISVRLILKSVNSPQKLVRSPSIIFASKAIDYCPAVGLLELYEVAHFTATFFQDHQSRREASPPKLTASAEDGRASKKASLPTEEQPSPAKLPHQDSKVTSTKRTKKAEYTCEECNISFVTLLTLKQHREGHKKNDCSKCSAKFAKRRQLVNHLKAVHLISTAEKYYECPYCPRRFVKKPSLWFHYTVHVKVILAGFTVILNFDELVRKIYLFFHSVWQGCGSESSWFFPMRIRILLSQCGSGSSLNPLKKN